MPTSPRPITTALLVIFRRGRWSCCGAQNFCAALRRTLKILTAATRSLRCFCHWQRSVRSPHRPAVLHLLLPLRRAGPMCPTAHRTPCKKPCHCEASAHTGVAIRIPRPLDPLAQRETIFIRPIFPPKNAPAPWVGAFSILSRPPHRSICAPLSAKSFLTLCFWAGVMRSLYCCASAAARAVSPPLK